MAARWPQLPFLFILCCALPLFASGPTGTITGTITDPSGAVIPKARIVVRNEGTNATREAQEQRRRRLHRCASAAGALQRGRGEHGISPQRHPRRRSWMWTRRFAWISRWWWAPSPRR